MAYLGNTPELQNFTAGADRFSGNASTTVFTLNRRVTSANDVIAYIESVPQDPFSAYTISANTVSGTADVTFTSAPPTGTNNIVINYRATQIVSYNRVTASVIEAGAITTVKIADANVTNDKIVSVANTKITGNIISSQITSVANTQITGVINTAQIADSAITTDKIAANAVVTAGIANGNVTAAKLANTAVTAGVYGGAENVSVITVDQQGRITAASNVAIGGFPAGTRMSFQQSSAPTGWTKDTTAAINDSILRLVTGSVTTGGTTGFSTWNAQTATGATTLSTSEIPSHTHSLPGGASGAAVGFYSPVEGGAGYNYTSGSTGGGGSHTHSLTQSLKYYDFIIASKN